MELFTYVDMAKLFRVQVSTIRNWRSKGFFRPLGYRRLGRWVKEAVVSEEEVKLLIKRKYIDPFKRRSKGG